MPKIKLLVTGSGGFVFTNFIRQVAYTKQNYNVVSIDKICQPHSIHNMYTHVNHKFFPGDICDPHFINVIFESEKPDVVIHGAVENSQDNLSTLNSNVLGTQNIINSCIKSNVKKLIYISSDSVYDKQSSEYDESWLEDSNLLPRNIYSTSKLFGESLVTLANQTHNLDYIIVRPSNMYGPWQYSNKYIPNIIKSVLNNENVKIHGNGSAIRDWMHVFDFCSALFYLINNDIKNEIFNVSTRQVLSNIEVFQKICNVLNKGHNLMEYISDKSNNDKARIIDSSKINKLGWESNFKFKDGIIQATQWYLNNQWFFKL